MAPSGDHGRGGLSGPASFPPAMIARTLTDDTFSEPASRLDPLLGPADRLGCMHV